MADMDAQEYFDRGHKHYEEEDWDQAISDFSEAIKIVGDLATASVYEMRGLAYANKKDYDKAIADFSESIRINPKESIYYRRRGEMYGEKGDHTQAIAECTEAIRIDLNDRLEFQNPNSLLTDSWAKPYTSRGIEYMKIKKYKLAIADFESAVELCPDETYLTNLEIAKNARKRSIKFIWMIAGAAVGAIIGGSIGGGYGAFFGAIIGAFPLPIIRFIGRWVSKA